MDTTTSGHPRDQPVNDEPVHETVKSDESVHDDSPTWKDCVSPLVVPEVGPPVAMDPGLPPTRLPRLPRVGRSSCLSPARTVSDAPSSRKRSRERSASESRSPDRSRRRVGSTAALLLAGRAIGEEGGGTTPAGEDGEGTTTPAGTTTPPEDGRCSSGEDDRAAGGAHGPRELLGDDDVLVLPEDGDCTMDGGPPSRNSPGANCAKVERETPLLPPSDSQSSCRSSLLSTVGSNPPPPRHSLSGTPVRGLSWPLSWESLGGGAGAHHAVQHDGAAPHGGSGSSPSNTTSTNHFAGAVRAEKTSMMPAAGVDIKAEEAPLVEWSVDIQEALHRHGLVIVRNCQKLSEAGELVGPRSSSNQKLLSGLFLGTRAVQCGRSLYDFSTWRNGYDILANHTTS